MILLPHRWTRQPVGPVEINWSHPLAAGLVFFYPGSRAINVVNGDEMSSFGTAVVSPPSTQGGPVLGLATDFSGSNLQYHLLEKAPTTSNTLSMAAHINSRVGTANFQCVLALTESAADRGYRVLITTTNTVSFQHLGTAGTAVCPTTATITANKWHHVGAINRGTSDRSVWLDGRNRVNNTTNAGNATPVRTAVGMYRGLTPLYGFDGPIAAACIWARDIGENGNREHQLAPWQFCQPYRSRIYILPSAGGGSISGSLNSTFDPVTMSASGTLRISGLFTSTFDPITLTAVGQLPVSGNLTATFSPVTLSATGTLPLSGSLSSTFSALTLSATGTLALTGSLAATFDPATLTATGVGTAAPIAGSLDATFEPITLTATGSLRIAGNLAATFDPVTLTSVGSFTIFGTGSSTFSPVTLTATSTALVSGSLSSTFSAITIAATGVVALSGAGEATLDPVTVTGVGTLALLGTLSATFNPVTLTATSGIGTAAAIPRDSARSWRVQVQVRYTIQLDPRLYVRP